MAPAGLTVGRVAEIVSGAMESPDGAAADQPIEQLTTVAEAGPRDVTFADHRRWLDALVDREVAAVLVGPRLAVPDGVRATVIRVPDVEHGVADLLDHLRPTSEPAVVGVHPSAHVDPSATIGPGAAVGPHVTVGPRTRVGAGTVLDAGTVLGADVVVGDHGRLAAGVVVGDRCRIGDRVLLHPGVVVGTDGFNYRPWPDGRGLRKIAHIGSVQLGHDVEIGANSCVDRGKFGSTVLGDGCKLDNLVQVGHNCVFGRCVVVAAGCHIGGSVRMDDGVMMGGGTNVRDHVHIGPGAQVGGNSGVVKDVPAGARVVGFPADDVPRVLREWASRHRIRPS